MKRILLLVLMCVLIMVAPSYSAVSGECVNCHTMHNSQGGQPVASAGVGASWDAGVITGGSSDVAQAQLLVSDCVGCHSSVGSETIIPLGTSRIPIVFNVSQPNKPLAGGNFYWVLADDNNGHNVFGITGPDSEHIKAPGSNIAPGGPCAECHTTLATASSGCKGCHMARHHDQGTDNIADVDDGWYRFLGSATMWGNHLAGGVEGIEDPNWEQNPTSSQHNVYKGTTSVYGEGDSSTTVDGSMNSFCSGCHSVFHAESKVGGAWVRHPSDIVLPATGEYADYTVYNPLVPMARQTLAPGDSSNGTVTPGTDMVSCLSCHRAHGSPYGDMLRWDYVNGCSAGTSNTACGCFTCHTTKD